MGQSKAMQVTQPGGQLCKQCKWCHLVAKFATNASGAIWWSNLQLMQVAPFSGQIWNLCKWRHLVAKYATNASHGVNFQSHIMVVLLTENIFQGDKNEKYKNKDLEQIKLDVFCALSPLNVYTTCGDLFTPYIFDIACVVLQNTICEGTDHCEKNLVVQKLKCLLFFLNKTFSKIIGCVWWR